MDVYSNISKISSLYLPELLEIIAAGRFLKNSSDANCKRVSFPELAVSFHSSSVCLDNRLQLHPCLWSM